MAPEEIRRRTIRLSCETGAGHLAPSLSCVEILTSLFGEFLRFKEGEPAWDGRDRLVFSKGHGAYAYYVILNKLGFLPDFELEHFYGEGATIKGCLTANPGYMIEASTGSLGHGLPIAVGMAQALKMQGKKNRVVCIVGDGEMQEGSNYEALQLAYRFKLDNLMVIVDGNELQAMDRVSDVGLDNVTRHVAEMTERVLDILGRACLPDGTPAVEVYGPTTTEARGGTVAFNLRGPDGAVLPYGDVERAASAVGISLRGGCFCNPGAAERALDLPPGEALECFEGIPRGSFTLKKFARCIGAEHAVGALRVSVGIPTTHADLDRFQEFLDDFCRSQGEPTG